MGAPLPVRVVAFLEERMDSVSLLEALLALRAEPDRAWTPKQLSDTLTSRPHAAAGYLTALERLGFAAAAPGGWRYDPPVDAAAVIDEVADLYPRRRASLVAVIYGATDAPARFTRDRERTRS